MAAPTALHAGASNALNASTTPEISVVVAVFNERESLPQLCDEIRAALEALGRPWEAILVDDGSNDGSRALEREIAERDPRFRCVHLRRNYGKAAALNEGFRSASGQLVITMDGDLQDDPAFIEAMIAPIESGEADLVSGWKWPRLDPITKTWPSKVYNLVSRVATGLHLHDMNCGYKAYRAEVVRELYLYGDMHRYIPVLAVGMGFRVTEVKTTHRPRIHGHSKYAFKRFIHGFLDLLTVVFLVRYRRRPLHLIGVLGLLLGGAGLAILAYLTVLWFFGEPLSNRPLLFAGMLMVLVSGQFFTFGLLAEMLTYYHLQGRRDYSIEARYGFERLSSDEQP
jgi:glycosyltransferase involved in cell wall biosynthesis